MKFIGLIVIACVGALAGCSYQNIVDVEIQTDSKGRLASARVVNPSDDEKFNQDALVAAKRRFPIRVPDAKPDHTYNQPVSITYPLIRTPE